MGRNRVSQQSRYTLHGRRAWTEPNPTLTAIPQHLTHTYQQITGLAGVPRLQRKARPAQMGRGGPGLRRSKVWQQSRNTPWFHNKSRLLCANDCPPRCACPAFPLKPGAAATRPARLPDTGTTPSIDFKQGAPHFLQSSAIYARSRRRIAQDANASSMEMIRHSNALKWQHVVLCCWKRL